MSESVEITAENIPGCMQLYFEELRDYNGVLIRNQEAIWMDQKQLAKVANFLITNGVVSPPVYVIRDTDNDRLLHEIVSGEVFMTAKPDKAEIDGAVFEHWKGQMQ